MTKRCVSVLLCSLLLFTLCFAPALAEAPKKLVVLGDSIAWGTGIYNSESACYAKIVADTNGYAYANYAYNGCRSWDLLALMERKDVKSDIASADIINISIGGNDYLQQNLLVLVPEIIIGENENMDNIEKDFYEYFTEIITRTQTLNPEAVIIVNELYNPEAGVVGSIYGEAVKRVNRVINRYLSENPDAFYWMKLADVMENHPENIAIDTIHPSAVGNVVIAERMLKTLYDLGLGENTDPVIYATGIDELPFSSYLLKAISDIFRRLFSLLNFSV